MHSGVQEVDDMTHSEWLPAADFDGHSHQCE